MNTVSKAEIVAQPVVDPGNQQEALRAFINSLLLRHAVTLHDTSPGSWVFEPNDRRRTTVCIRLEPCWCVLEIAPGYGRVNDAMQIPGRRAWALLVRNSRLVDGLGYMLEAPFPRLLMRAELPLVQDDGLGIRDLRCYLDSVISRFIGSLYTPKPLRQAVGTTREIDIRNVCEESGWGYEIRGRHIAVPLEVSHGGYMAVLEAANGGLSMKVDIADMHAANMDPVCSHALALHLLRSSACIRMVRAILSGRRGMLIPQFEVFLATPSVPLVQHALSALSVVCEHSGREADALASSAGCSRRYLEILGAQSYAPACPDAGSL